MRRIIFFLAFIFISTLASAQEFAAVTPGRTFSFPQDHASHKPFKTEWWYFTGHLKSPEGRRFGFQWTVFRIALRAPTSEKIETPSEWRADDIYAGHVAISDLDEKQFYFAQSSFRGAMGLASSSAEKLELKLPGFSAESTASSLQLSAQRDKIALNLQMNLNAPVLLQGEKGYSPKSFEAGKASYYYSMPHLATQGSLKIGEKIYSVQGQAWMDHEFGSDKLSKSQTGWDWFGLPLGEKSSLTLYRVRNEEGPSADFLAGTYVDQAGLPHALKKADIVLTPQSYWTSPATKAKYPIAWQIEIPQYRLKLKVDADFAQQELDTTATTQVIYWEGSVQVRGEAEGLPINSQGYLEMTGYARKFERKI